MDYLAPRDVAPVKANPNLVEVDVPSLADFGYTMNMTKPPFDNKALRLAVSYALDREAIVKGVWLGIGVASNGPIPPSSWAYDSSIAPIKRDRREGEAVSGGGRQAGRLQLRGHREQHADPGAGAGGDEGATGRGRDHDGCPAGRSGPAPGRAEPEDVRDAQLAVERSARSGREHLPVLQDADRERVELRQASRTRRRTRSWTRRARSRIRPSGRSCTASSPRSCWRRARGSGWSTRSSRRRSARRSRATIRSRTG